VSKAGLMMVDVTRRVSQWDQRRIMSAVDSGAGKITIVGGHRPSVVSSSRAASVGGDDDEPRPSTAATTAATSAVDVAPKLVDAGGAGPAAALLTVPDQGQLRPAVFFTARRYASAVRGMCCGRLSVRPSQNGIVAKRLDG